MGSNFNLQPVGRRVKSVASPRAIFGSSAYCHLLIRYLVRLNETLQETLKVFSWKLTWNVFLKSVKTSHLLIKHKQDMKKILQEILKGPLSTFSNSTTHQLWKFCRSEKCREETFQMRIKQVSYPILFLLMSYVFEFIGVKASEQAKWLCYAVICPFIYGMRLLRTDTFLVFRVQKCI